MLVGPLPWKKSGRETWQKVSRSSEVREGTEGEEGGGKGEEGSKLQSRNHCRYTQKMVKYVFKCLLLVDLTT